MRLTFEMWNFNLDLFTAFSFHWIAVYIYCDIDVSTLMRARKNIFCLLSCCTSNLSPHFVPRCEPQNRWTIGAKGKSVVYTYISQYRHSHIRVYTFSLARCFETHRFCRREHISYMLTRALACLSRAFTSRGWLRRRPDIRLSRVESSIYFYLSISFSFSLFWRSQSRWQDEDARAKTHFVWATSYFSHLVFPIEMLMKSDDPRSLSSLFLLVSLPGIVVLDGDIDVATLLSQLLTADRAATSRCLEITNFANSNCTSVRIVSSSNRRTLNLN